MNKNYLTDSAGYGGYAPYAGGGAVDRGYDYGGGYGESGAVGSRSMRDYVLMFRERIWWLIVTFFIIFSGTILYTYQATPIYRAGAVVEVLRDDPKVIQSPSDLDQGFIRDDIDLNTLVSRLQSSAITLRVRERMSDDLYARLMAPYEGALELFEPITPERVLTRNRNIGVNRGTRVITVTYSHPDPTVARDVANLYAEEFEDESLDRSIQQILDATEALRGRVDQQRAMIEDLNERMERILQENDNISIDAERDLALARLSEIDARRSERLQNLRDLEIVWQKIEEFRDTGRDLWEIPYVGSRERIQRQLEMRSQLQIDIDTLSERYRAKWPALVELRERLSAVEEQLAKSIDDAVNSARTELEQARDLYEKSEQAFQEQQQRVFAINELRPEFEALRSRKQVQETIYQSFVDNLSRRLAELNLVDSQISIVERAVEPTRASSPNFILNLSLGFFGGIGAGVGLVLLVALADDRVKSAFDIETTVGLPLIGIVPRLRRLADSAKAQAVASNVNRHLTEAFRTIYSTLKLNDDSKNAKVILVTSTLPGEGKSFVSTNLSLTFANHGERVLLVDGDLRLPNVARSLQINPEAGLVHAFEDKNITIEDAIIRDLYPNFDVLPAGRRANNPTQMFCSTEFEEKMFALREKYDRIIVDSPPLGAVSDALNLLPLVDGVVYLIKFNTVKRKTARLNVRRIWESGTTAFGAILNNISDNVSGYYYSHYYDRRQKSYYLDNDDSDIENPADEGLQLARRQDGEIDRRKDD